MNEKTVVKKIEIFPTNITFLVIEDMDNIRRQMVSDLKAIGVAGKICEAPNVQAAVKICGQEEIGFVISDWNLPDGTGKDFLKKFREVPKFKKIPFIMCTTNDEIGFFLEAVTLGANDYIVKPWKQEDLKKKIQMAWESFINKKK